MFVYTQPPNERAGIDYTAYQKHLCRLDAIRDRENVMPGPREAKKIMQRIEKQRLRVTDGRLTVFFLRTWISGSYALTISLAVNEILIAERILYVHLAENNLLSRAQHGFYRATLC